MQACLLLKHAVDPIFSRQIYASMIRSCLSNEETKADSEACREEAWRVMLWRYINHWSDVLI